MFGTTFVSTVTYLLNELRCEPQGRSLMTDV